MKKLLMMFLSLMMSGAFANKNLEMLRSIKKLTRFTFGSCNKENFKQPYWSYMERDNPQFFLLGGDNVYADAKNLDDLIKKYNRQMKNPGFQRFTSMKPIIGVWDDHDYGLNNSNGSIGMKEDRQRLFLDYIREPKDTIRRKQQGIYTTYTFGEPPQQVKFILLDTRYFKDTIVDGKRDLLGVAQWQWLENEFANSKAQVNFIVSSITVNLDEKGRKSGEEWRDYPNSREKLFDLIENYSLPGVIFLTGDKHFSVYLESEENGKVYPEFMASSLTHPSFPFWMFVRQPKLARRLYLKPNYGLVDLDWKKSGGVDVIFRIISSYKGEIIKNHHVHVNERGLVK